MNKGKKVKIGIAAGILAVAAVLIFISGGRQKPKGGGMGMRQEALVTVVKAQPPSVGDIRLTTGLTGAVEPSDVVRIYAKAGGDVEAVFIKAGDVVTQGQVLFEIDTEQVENAKNAMDSAAVKRSEAESNLSRMQILYSSGDLSQQEYEQHVNGAKSARLQYDSAKLAYDRQVEYSTVKAPIGGRIESCDIEVHDRVSQSQDLCVIAGEGENRISFYVTQRMMLNCMVGDKLEIQKNGTTYDAYISEINSIVDTDTGLFKVEAQMEETEEIAAGSTVKLNLVTQKAENAMLVPIDAVYYSGGSAFVYLYRDGIAAMVQVEIGLEDSEYAQILSGLSETDLVVSTWSSNLYEGAKIRLRDEGGAGEAPAEEAVPESAGEESGQESALEAGQESALEAGQESAPKAGQESAPEQKKQTGQEA